MFAAGKAASGAEPTDAQFNYVTMLLHGNGTNGAQNNTFVDSSTNNFTITRNGNTTQGTFTPYGSNWSNYFDGSSDLRIASNAAFAIGTGNFTFEAWINPPSWASAAPFFVCTGTGGLWIGKNGSNFVVRAYGVADQLQYATVPTTNVWTHIVAVRSGTTLSLFYNGTRVATTTNSYSFAQQPVSIGSDGETVAPTYYTGYISNLRLVKGTAVYDPTASTLTVPTTPLTAITNTSLLTCQSNRFIDNSTNNFTITKNGDVSVQRFSPFSPTTAYSTSVIGGSGYFDGSGDYLVTPSSSAFNFGTGDFQIEAWVYLFNVTDRRFIYGTGGSGQQNQFWIETDRKVGYYDGTADRYSTGTIQLNSWNQVALARSGSTCTFYVNGVASGTFTSSASLGATSQAYIGRRSDALYAVAGYISDLRILKGVTSAPSGNPTSPLTAISGTSLLLSYTNAGILDNAMMNDLETVGNAQISTSVKKYGTGSMAFDGTGDYLTVQSNPNIQFGSGSFTIEGWVYSNNIATPQVVMVRRAALDARGFSIVIDPSALSFAAGDSNTSAWEVTISSGTLLSGTWYHFAFVRNGSSWMAFVNGVQVGSTVTWTGAIADETSPLIIGANSNLANGLNGYIDDLRITKGVARYTANFSVPTAAFPDKG